MSKGSILDEEVVGSFPVVLAAFSFSVFSVQCNNSLAVSASVRLLAKDATRDKVLSLLLPYFRIILSITLAAQA